jgi:hypothetical protein
MAVPGPRHTDFENKGTNTTSTNQYWGDSPVKLGAEIQAPGDPNQVHLHRAHFHHT